VAAVAANITHQHRMTGQSWVCNKAGAGAAVCMPLAKGLATTLHRTRTAPADQEQNHSCYTDWPYAAAAAIAAIVSPLLL
jgi:hypothetical protein